MKTIEERAKKYALQFEERYQVAMFKAYIDGATEQKKIDDQHILFLSDAYEYEKKMLIDKACEWMAKNVVKYVGMFTINTIEDYKEKIEVRNCVDMQLYEDFRKAMNK